MSIPNWMADTEDEDEMYARLFMDNEIRTEDPWKVFDSMVGTYSDEYEGEEEDSSFDPFQWAEERERQLEGLRMIERGELIVPQPEITTAPIDDDGDLRGSWAAMTKGVGLIEEQIESAFPSTSGVGLMPGDMNSVIDQVALQVNAGSTIENAVDTVLKATVSEVSQETREQMTDAVAATLWATGGINFQTTQSVLRTLGNIWAEYTPSIAGMSRSQNPFVRSAGRRIVSGVAALVRSFPTITKLSGGVLAATVAYKLYQYVSQVPQEYIGPKQKKATAVLMAGMTRTPGRGYSNKAIHSMYLTDAMGSPPRPQHDIRKNRVKDATRVVGQVIIPV